MFDNRVFNVNGKSPEQLTAAIELAAQLYTNRPAPFAGWRIIEDKGFVLLWHVKEKGYPFPSNLSATQVSGIVWEWLQSEEAKKIKLSGYDADQDHDGSNGKGWRVYCEGWGHVGDEHYSIVAITPAHLWYGK